MHDCMNYLNSIPARENQHHLKMVSIDASLNRIHDYPMTIREKCYKINLIRIDVTTCY